MSLLLLLTALAINTPSLVLKSGERISVDAGIQANGVTVTFRSNGSLYSVPAEEVDFDATRAASAAPAAPVDEKKKLTVSAPEKERLLRELEQNHSGTPAPKEQLTIPDQPRRTSADLRNGDEWQWRNGARAHEENVKRAKEQLQLLRDRQEELKSRIMGFLSQGYKPMQFSYETTQLASVEQQIPQAELEVRRAERAQAQFLDDARRQGIMPGWLR